MHTLAFLLGFIPFSLPGGLPPIASFWNEYSFLILYLLLIFYLINNKKRIEINGVSKLFSLSLIILLQQFLLFACTALSSEESWQKTLILVPIIIASSLHVNKIDEQKILRGICIGLLGAVAINFIYLILIKLNITASLIGFLISEESAGLSRFNGALRQPNQTAALMVIGLIAAEYNFKTKVIGFRLMFILSGMCGILLSATASRSGLLVFAILTFSYFLFDIYKRVKFYNGALTRSFYIAFPFLIIANFSNLSSSTLSNRFSSDIPDNFSGRLEIWANAVDIIKIHPITGIGLNDFSYLYFTTGERVTSFLNAHQSHNVITDLFLFFGIPIGLLITCHFILILYRAIKKNNLGFSSPSANNSNFHLKISLLFTLITFAMFELPHWYVYYLMPTIWLLNSMDEKYYIIKFKNSLIISTGFSKIVSIFVLILLIGYGLVYIPIQKYYIQTSIETSGTGLMKYRLDDLQVPDIDIAEVLKMGALPFFKSETNYLIGRSIGLDGFQRNFDKLNLVSDNLHHSNNEHTIAKSIIFNFAIGDKSVACDLMRSSERTNDEHHKVLALIKGSIENNEKLSGFNDFCMPKRVK